MGKTKQDQDIIIIPPGYAYVADELSSDEENLSIVFLDSVDGQALDEENYTDNVPQDVDLDIPKAFQAPKNDLK
ncbi:MAG: hypothetical protein CL561_08715 [Alphaproteobacteria bacterium]|nr:hypothetical protein [Alphaproteobacteria bacterium]|tara:strand:- start:11624 stop:11845 length:222 start_codon:yes stop_codon:yes gene_type:complete